MVWLDTVLDDSADGGICAVDLRADALYFGADGAVMPFAPIEWMAQCFGYARAAYSIRSGAPQTVTRGFLAGVGSYELLKPLPRQGRLVVEARMTRLLSPLALVKGSVRTDAGDELARAQLKVYFEEA
jgi:predicted hotdog family 3-hydroxylacyl-ACP dehydratase